MAIYTVSHGENNRKDDYLPEIERFRTRDELQTSVRFHDEIPLESIKQYIKGMAWEVDYFNQVGDINDIDFIPDSKLSIGAQKYNRISKLRIFVEQTISQTAVKDIKVSGVINANFRPRKYDVFIATLMGGRIGLFKVVEVKMEHYNLHPIYTVDFEIISFLEDNSDLYNTLIAKVVGNYIYNKDYNRNNADVVLTREEYAIIEDVKEAISDISDYYFRTFIDPDTKLLKLPTTSAINYVDQELGKFCRKVFSVLDYPMLTELQTVDYDMDKSVRYTIWDVILERNPKLLRRAEPFIGFIPSPIPKSNLNSIHAHFLDVDYIVDKTDFNTTLLGVEDTSTYPDLGLDKFPILNAVREDDKKNIKTAAKAWDEFIPELDFSVKKTVSGEDVTTPVKEELYGKPKEEPKPEPKFQVDNLNTLIGNKVEKEDVTTEEPSKPINRNIPDIRATKQYKRQKG